MHSHRGYQAFSMSSRYMASEFDVVVGLLEQLFDPESACWRS